MTPNMTPLDWTASALCAQADPDAWYPDADDIGTRETAKAICRRCPVINECRDLADELEGISLHTLHGIWGGEPPSQRRRRRKTQEAAA